MSLCLLTTAALAKSACVLHQVSPLLLNMIPGGISNVLVLLDRVRSGVCLASTCGVVLQAYRLVTRNRLG
jgi:hypothetical protein